MDIGTRNKQTLSDMKVALTEKAREQRVAQLERFAKSLMRSHYDAEDLETMLYVDGVFGRDSNDITRTVKTVIRAKRKEQREFTEFEGMMKTNAAHRRRPEKLRKEFRMSGRWRGYSAPNRKISVADEKRANELDANKREAEQS